MQSTPRTWRPLFSSAKRDDAALARRTDHAISNLVNAISRTRLPPFQRAVKAIQRLEKGYGSGLCYPEVNDWYFQLSNASQSNEKIDLGDYLKRLETTADAISHSRARALANQVKLGACIDLSTRGSWVRSALRRGESFVGELSTTPVHLEVFPELPEDVLSRLKKAFQLLKDVWREAYDEIPWFVRRLIVYKGHAIIGFTDFRFHGSVFFKYERMMKRVTLAGVAEDLVHEAAHVRLNAIMGAEPLFTNDHTPLYRTPLRNDLRPMYGVFHQMYVLTRLTELYSRVLSHTNYKCEPALQVNLEGARYAHSTVVAHAKLTVAGQRLVRTIGRRLNQSTCS